MFPGRETFDIKSPVTGNFYVGVCTCQKHNFYSCPEITEIQQFSRMDNKSSVKI